MIWIVVFVILNLLDAYLTRQTVKKGGRELNPIIRKLGMWKVKAGGLVVVVIWWLLTGVVFPIYLLNLLLLCACIWNAIQLFGQKEG